MATETAFGTFPDNFGKYLRPTTIVDADNGFIRKQAKELTKDAKTLLQAVSAIHAFVASFPLGFDDEARPASFILKQRRGQCNTKTALFLALCRAAGIPTQVHAYKVHKFVHRRYMPALVYMCTPATTVFLYPVVYYKKKWRFLCEVLSAQDDPDYERCPFDDAPNRKVPLQQDMIAEDLAEHWNPDIVYHKYGTNSSGWRKPFFPIAQFLLNNAVKKQ